jgi:hypothetical protein
LYYACQLAEKKVKFTVNHGYSYGWLAEIGSTGLQPLPSCLELGGSGLTAELRRVRGRVEFTVK